MQSEGINWNGVYLSSDRLTGKSWTTPMMTTSNVRQCGHCPTPDWGCSKTTW